MHMFHSCCRMKKDFRNCFFLEFCVCVCAECTSERRTEPNNLAAAASTV